MRIALFCLVMVAFAAHGAEAEWSVRVSPFDGIYPSLELSQAQRPYSATLPEHVMGQGTGLIAIEVRSRQAGDRALLRLAMPPFKTPEVQSLVLRDGDATYQIHPRLRWDVAQLRALDEPLATHLDVGLEQDGRQESRRLDVTIHPLDEALYFVRDGSEAVDLSWIFAAYVDEHDAVVDTILDDPTVNAIADRFDGYTSGDSDAVYRQAWAIWHALTARGIRYSSVDPAIERGPNVFSQHVRSLDATWNDRSANCIDGSVLIASVLQRVGIRSFLVLVPGHAFVGFYLDAAGKQTAYLETTVLGADVPNAAKLPAFGASVATTATLRSSLNGFAAALATGRAQHARVARKLDGRHRPDYVVIDIAAAREFGIRPIGESLRD